MSLLKRIERLESQLLPARADAFALGLEERLAELRERYATGWRGTDGPDLRAGLSFKEKLGLIGAHHLEEEFNWRLFERERGGGVPEPALGRPRAASEPEFQTTGDE